MATADINKATAVIQGIGSGYANLDTRSLFSKSYIEHNPLSGDGVGGLKEFIGLVSKEDHHLNIVRSFQDGDFVVLQSDGLVLGKNTFFDVFRFTDGLIAEHWTFSSPGGPPNKSGHTQVDGPIAAKHLGSTEENKAFMRDYYQTFHIARDHSRNDEWFPGDVMIRHEPGVRDGLGEFLHDVEELMKHRTIDEVKLLLGYGDFVFIAAKGTHEGNSCAYIDLYRVAEKKVVEHWGFPEKIPPRNERKNHNDVL